MKNTSIAHEITPLIDNTLFTKTVDYHDQYAKVHHTEMLACKTGKVLMLCKATPCYHPNLHSYMLTIDLFP